MTAHKSGLRRNAIWRTLAVLACFLAAGSLYGQKHGPTELKPMSPDLDRWGSKLMDMASPQLRSWILDEARQLAGKSKLDAGAIGAAANARFGGKNALTKDQQEVVAGAVLYQVAKLDQQQYKVLAARKAPGASAQSNIREAAIQPKTAGQPVKTTTSTAANKQDLQAQDKLGNFDVNELMSQYNQAETLASSIMKKKDDAGNAVIQKI